MKKQKKINFTISVLALGSGIYFFFCLFFVVAGFFWFRALLGQFSKTEKTSIQITQEFASFIEKEKSMGRPKGASPVLAQTLGAAQQSFRSLAKESAHEKGKVLIDNYLESERNREFIVEVRNCLSGETDSFLLGFLVANKRQSTKLDSDLDISQLALDAIKNDPEAFRDKMSYSIRAMEDNTQCGQESYLLKNLYRSFFPN